MADVRPGVAAIFFLMFAVSLFMSCSTGRENVSLPLSLPESFSDSGNRRVPDQWWTAFGDPELNTLVNRALQENFDLKTAWQRLKAARAAADRQSADLYPELEGFFEAETRRSESEDMDQLRIGLSSVYELDLWGKIRSRTEAEQYRARATFLDYQTAALTLSAEVTRTWYQLAAAQGRLALLRDQIETNEKVLQLLKTRFASGQSRSVDVIRQRQLLESTREEKHAAESRVQVLFHQLAVLTGQPPGRKIFSSPENLPDLPPLPQTGLPTELVRRRPDVRRAYYRLQAADRDLSAAISNRYPRVTISASLSSAGGDADDIFQDWARSFSGSLVAPLLDAGKRAAEAERVRAEKNQRLYEYGQSVLTAFQEVEDALIQEEKQITQIRSLEKQLRHAKQAYEQLRSEYANGISNFIDVLEALTDRQQLQRELISARRVLLEYRIALYRALAGGFETPRQAREQG